MKHVVLNTDDATEQLERAVLLRHDDLRLAPPGWRVVCAPVDGRAVITELVGWQYSATQGSWLPVEADEPGLWWCADTLEYLGLLSPSECTNIGIGPCAIDGLPARFHKQLSDRAA